MQIKKIITKFDMILFFILILAGTALTFASVSAGSRVAAKVFVTVAGKEYGSYDLSKNQTVTIDQNGHTNEFIIKDGRVQMTKASCKNHVCIDTGAIETAGRSIVCLPNKVVIEIKGGEAEYDAIAN